VGPGWDGAVLGLGLFLPEVVKDSGTATAEQLAGATEVSLAQFAPDLTTPQHQQHGH
jgi:hypothetical protein